MSIEFTSSLNNWKFSAEILVPAFVKPVYLSDFTNSLIVTPGFPPKSSTLMRTSVSAFFLTEPMSFSIV